MQICQHMRTAEPRSRSRETGRDEIALRISQIRSRKLAGARTFRGDRRPPGLLRSHNAIECFSLYKEGRMRNPVRAATPNDFVISTIATMARSVEMIYPCLPNTADPKKWLSSQKWQIIRR